MATTRSASDQDDWSSASTSTTSNVWLEQSSSEDANLSSKIRGDDDADDGSSSQSSQESPSLFPSQNHPMTNSIISNLDLSEEQQRRLGESDANGIAEDEVLHGSSGSDGNGASAGAGASTFNSGRSVPLAPRDVLSPSNSLSSLNFGTSTNMMPFSQTQHLQEGSGVAASGADDSALDALVEAHQRPTSTSASAEDGEEGVDFANGSSRRADTTIPNTRDASFGLDPDADTSHSIQGAPFRPLGGSSTSRNRQHHGHSKHGERSIYEEGQEHAPSHTTASTGAPETSKVNSSHTQTVPTASATGMPRFLPRRTSLSPPQSPHSSHSSEAPPPKEVQPNYAPSGSLTIAIFAKGITWRRRSYLLLASFAINLGLPFLNGVMLGFGEIFARSVVAPWIGLAPGAVNINAPGSSSASTTSGVGLRYAGVGQNRDQVSLESWEVEPGRRGRGREEL